MRRWVGATLLLGNALLLSGCHVDMWVQPKMKPYYESDFFSDRSELRPIVPHTVAVGGLESRLDDAYMLGRTPQGKYVPQIPVKAVRSFVSPKAMLERGQDRYNAFCSPCHGKTGNGNGMITQRGLGYWQKLPASYFTDRLRKIEDGYLYDVLVNGHGVMYGYGSRIQDINDRWSVIAYTRALQLAHNADPALATAEARESVAGQKPAKEPGDSKELGEGVDDNAVTKPTVKSGTMGTERPVNRTPGGGGAGSENADQTGRGAESSAGGGGARARVSPESRTGTESGQTVSPNAVPTTAPEGAGR
ncbi:MAG: cytochrome c [Cytophagales bacterium]|nr:cytochrome c [Armatimonadota bacterium]